MKAVVSDFDGVLVETEAAKAVGWYAAVKRLKGELTTDDVADIIARNSRGQRLAISIVEELKKSKNSVLPRTDEDITKLYRSPREKAENKMPKLGLKGIQSQLAGKSDMEIALWCAGGETDDFRDNIWNVFLANNPRFRDLSPVAREEKLGELLKYRGELKEPFMALAAEPIEGNQRFFGGLIHELGEGNVALVNQSTSESMKQLFDLDSKWPGYAGIPRAFGTFNPDKTSPNYGFAMTFNAGDKKDKEITNKPKLADKAHAYRRACEVMGVKPLETMTFEDTTSGVEAAVEAGVGIIIGFRLVGSTQDLSKAHYVVGDSLEKINEITSELKNKTPDQVRDELNRLAARGVITKNIQAVDELTPPPTQTTPVKPTLKN